MKMDFAFKTITEFNDYFKDEKTCYEFLETQNWQGIPVYPHFGPLKKPCKVKVRGKFTDIPSYRCSERACDLPFTIRTGSIFLLKVLIFNKNSGHGIEHFSYYRECIYPVADRHQRTMKNQHMPLNFTPNIRTRGRGIQVFLFEL